MNKYTIKISYQPKWHPTEGTVYRKALRINNKIFESFLLALSCERIMEKDCYIKMNLNKSVEQLKNIVYLNLTQSRYFIDWAERQHEIIIDEKRASYDANTCLIISK